ncbi:DUF3945 domain-containing protein [Spirosoma sp. HMF3257]|uniref:Uncharacterized protein n=1 Tax=Spirosoma telluris TaxID=2183553 RepID=A0A327NKE0_9BACT|nr:DUF3945 domain-containing protein [Spirosoma telluris]RAI73008.1 hypothetical protein HMF3257_38485 [Spirosoma telluris]
MAKHTNLPKTSTIKIKSLGETIPEGEQLKEQFYEMLLPEEYQELRQYLGNDGFLSNDEISASLRDGRLLKEELTQKLSALNLPTEDIVLQEKMADYLWELHQIIIDPTVEEISANQYYQVEAIHPFPGGEQGKSEQEEMGQQPVKDRSLQIVNGGLIINFIHNFKKAYHIDETPRIDRVKKTRYQWQDAQSSLEKMGISRDLLAESGNLDRLLRGEKTGIIDFKTDFNGQEIPLRGKVYLVRDRNEVIPYFQTVKQKLQIPDQKLGYSFSPEDKDELAQKGELGKRVELEDPKTKEKFKAYIGVDQETNALTIWRADRVHIPMQIKGVTLSKEQQQTLEQGGAIRLSGLMSENGQKYDADIQISAGRRKFSFSPPSEAIKQSMDARTAKDITRTSDQLQGTSAGGGLQ